MLSIMERLKLVRISTLVGSVRNGLYSSAAHKGKNRRKHFVAIFICMPHTKEEWLFCKERCR